MPRRPPIPSDLERRILLEAGHRCAIHSCRQVPVEIAHIVPWARSRAHEFPNLIALCPTCHTRFDKGQIDRKSMYAYKRNAWMHGSRYSDLEKRLLLAFARDQTSDVWLLDGLRLLLADLLSDGLLFDSGTTRPDGFPETFRERLYKLSPDGQRFVAELRSVASLP